MKYAIAGVTLVVALLIGWYLYSNGQSVNEESNNQATTSSGQNSNSNSEAKTDGSTDGTNSAGANGNASGKTTDGAVTSSGNESQENNGDEETDEEDYSEPVSKEDFKDFINTALDELAEDETTAVAIVTEMDKIQRAQPNHEEEVARFYRECVKKNKVPQKVKDLCSAAMKERGLSN